MSNTLCPYSTKPLSEAAEVNGEHIIPSGLGAPESFTVPCSAIENSLMNQQVDAPFLNMPLLRLLSAGQGVSARSGEITAELQGVIESTGDKVKAVLGKGRADFRFAVPIETDDEGNVRRVKGFGPAAQALANQVQKNYAKKGKAIEVGTAETIASSTIHIETHLDLGLLRQQLTKIAYLMTVRVFGDLAIAGKSGQIFRDAILAKTEEAVKGTNIRGGSIDQIPPGFPVAAKNEHAATSVFMAGLGLITVVSLYGTFSAMFVTPADGIDVGEATGEVVIIDASTGKLTSEPYLSAMVRLVGSRIPDGFN